MHKDLLDDFDFMIKMAKVDESVLKYCNMGDEIFAMLCATKDLTMKYFTTSIRSNKNIMLEAIKNNQTQLDYVCGLKQDADIQSVVLNYILTSSTHKFSDTTLKNYDAFIRYLYHNFNSYSKLPEKLRNDTAFNIELLKHDSGLIKDMNIGEELAIAAVKIDKKTYAILPKELKLNKDVLMVYLS